ncbi:NAD(P)H-binding protein [bacterium SCSIO 12741]|nr:NAD(P)H-binding protein [bacterium SCSIO 12741]
MMKYTAVVVGATGLVGKFLVQELIEDPQCEKIRVIVRRKSFEHPKIEECIIDFTREDDYLGQVKGDVLFSCLGTTLRQAGSRENQFVVDYTYQFRAAQCGAQNGITHYVLVSSPFALLKSNNYYRRMKAQLEESVKALGFDKTVILQPNGLMGKRDKSRKAEEIAALFFTPLIRAIPSLRKYTPIHGSLVARAMRLSYLNSLKSDSRILVLNRNEVMLAAQGK